MTHVTGSASVGHKQPVDFVCVLNAEQLLMCLLCVSVVLHSPAKIQDGKGWLDNN